VSKLALLVGSLTGDAMKELDDLEKALLAEGAKATTVQDISAAAGALKTIAEARAASNSDVTSKRTYRLEYIKSLSAILVPVVSLLALAGTVIVQIKQTETTRQQIEDSEWRDLLSSLRGSPNAVYTDLTIAPRLTSFASSPAYGDQAKAIAIRFMGHLSNLDGFQDLFGYVFPMVDDKNVRAILDVARSLTKSKRALENRCSEIVGDTGSNPKLPILSACGESIDDKTFQQLTQDSDVGDIARKVSESRQSINTLNQEAQFLTDKLTNFLRLEYGLKDHGQPRETRLDLSDTFITNTDLSGVDFSKDNISNTIFDRVILSGSDLRTSKFEGVELRASNWWDAQTIDSGLLVYAIENYPPYFIKDVSLPIEITEQDYKKKVKDLCDRNHIQCPAYIKFQKQ
jgi:uncharacterized protein YjbI with pentapeptide repeats